MGLPCSPPAPTEVVQKARRSVWGGPGRYAGRGTYREFVAEQSA
jgi:hypothetical protein